MTRPTNPSPLKIKVEDALGNGTGLAAALKRAGHRLVADGRADVLLIELDMPMFEFRDTIDRYKQMGAKVWLYPHGAGPKVAYDNLYEPYEKVDGSLVFAHGHTELLRRLEYPRPVHAIGWYYCDIAPFRPSRSIRHVVFAPTHPSGGDNNTMADSNREANAETYARLLEGPWRLSVRHLGAVEQNGLWRVDGVNYVESVRDKKPVEIEAADAVVAGDGTFPSLALARGVPTVMYGQAHPHTYGLPDEPIRPHRHPERYLDYIRYPFDVEDGPLDEVLHAAARSEEPVAEWKRRFVGEQLQDDAFSALIGHVARARPGEEVAIDETRSFTVAGFAEELLERPQLLAAYADHFGPDDDATLILWGPGLEADAILAMVQAAAEAAGVDDDALPDILLLPLPGSPEADRAIAERSDAVLSEWPTVGQVGELPRVGAADVAELRRRAPL